MIQSQGQTKFLHRQNLEIKKKKILWNLNSPGWNNWTISASCEFEEPNMTRIWSIKKNCYLNIQFHKIFVKLTLVFLHTSLKNMPNKSRIRETQHLSTDADSSTDTTVGWTMVTQEPNFFLKNGKNHPKHKNSKTSRE